MITCSAPGKVYLLGEHAVVYGEPAIVGAINKRVFTSIRLTEDSNIRVSSMNKCLDCDSQEFKYVCAAANLIKNLYRGEFGAEIFIESQLVPSQGLGSSAAVTVSTLMALSESLSMDLKEHEIAALGHQVEQSVQGAASRADTLVSATGGISVVNGDKTSKLELPSVSLVIGATGITRSTRDLIQRVASLKNRHPRIVRSIMSSIGDISRLGQSKLIEGDMKGFGELMNINQGLLDSIGISNLELNTLIYAARQAGALGAKITGAGGGGCMFALAEKEHVTDVLNAITSCGGQPIRASFSSTGVSIAKLRAGRRASDIA